MYRGKLVYWLAQVLGWSFYGLLIYLSADNDDKSKPNFITALILTAATGIAVTHIYRQIIVAFNWFKFSILKLLPPVLLACLVIGGIFLGARIGLQTMLMDEPVENFSIQRIVLGSISQGVLIFMWSSLYFMYHGLEKSRIEEIKNLKWEASKNEIELNNLKAQLNPHFMFNSMNSIRALIDENPQRAKTAVTKLSTILRSTLMMGRKREITIREEMEVVRDYLDLESIRYEERLRVSYNIDEKLLEYSIPPLILQTAVENAIKHGISTLPKGGELNIKVSEMIDSISLTVTNSGQLKSNNDIDTGIGLANSRQRLSLMYGENASLQLRQDKENVITTLIIPKQKTNESNSGR